MGRAKLGIYLVVMGLGWAVGCAGGIAPPPPGGGAASAGNSGVGGAGGSGGVFGTGGSGGTLGTIGWCAAESVDIGASTDPGAVDMAVDPQGNVIIVWWDFEGDQNIWTNRWTPDAGWGTAERLQTQDGPGHFPRVVTDASGNAFAIWGQSDCESTNDIWSSRWTPSDGWSPAELLDTEEGYAGSPDLATDANGNAIAVWMQTDSTGVHSAWSNRWTHDTGWGTAERVQASDQEARDAQLVVDFDGTALATWRERNSENVYDLWLSRWTPNSGWSTPESSGATESVGSYQIALDRNGHVLVVWSTGSGQGFDRGLWSARWTGAWEQPVRVVEDRRTREPKVAFDANGNAFATWMSWPGADIDGPRVWAGRWTPEEGWNDLTLHQGFDEPFECEAPLCNEGWSWDPALAVDRDGNAFVLWEEIDFDGRNVWWVKWTPNLGWSDPERVNIAVAGSWKPAVTVDMEGNAIAVWRQGGLSSSRFDGTCFVDPGASGMGGAGGDGGTGGAAGNDPCEGVVCPDAECRSRGVCNPDDGTCTYANVDDDGTVCSEGVCLEGGCGRVGAYPCTEQGIREAITVGGGPHFFACDESIPVVPAEEIVIHNDVVLDGEGELVLGGSKPAQSHRSISVESERTVELRAIRTEEPFYGSITNRGSLTLVDSSVARVSNDGALTVIDTEIRGPELHNDGVATLTRVRITSTGPEPHAVAISNFGTMTVVDSTLLGPGYQPGGPTPYYWGPNAIWNSSSANLILEGTTVSNHFGRSIAAIRNDGTLTLENSTVADNTAERGPSVQNRGTMTLTNSTVSGAAVVQCGSYFNGYGIGNYGTLTVNNSTLAANAMGAIDNRGALTVTQSVIDGGCVQFAHAAFLVDAATTSGGYNIVGSTDTCGFNDPTDLVDVSSAALALGPLANNGGLTMTHAPFSSSVAIDAIPGPMCDVTEDQRGQPRPAGGMCDVGAVEVQP